MNRVGRMILGLFSRGLGLLLRRRSNDLSHCIFPHFIFQVLLFISTTKRLSFRLRFIYASQARKQSLPTDIGRPMHL